MDIGPSLNLTTAGIIICDISVIKKPNFRLRKMIMLTIMIYKSNINAIILSQ